MRLLDSMRTFCALAILTLTPSSFVLADDGPEILAPAGPGPSRSSDADDKLRQGVEFERQRNWSAAIEVYQEALVHAPGRSDLRQRMILCESHYKLNRRYLDSSFRTVLLRLPSETSLQLYEEILERIESHYVEPVALEPLLRRGLDNLEVALRDTSFLRANAPNVHPERIKQLRDLFKSRRELILAPSRVEARQFVLWACSEARTRAGIVTAAVILEFAYGACDALDDYTSYLTPNKLEDLFGLIDGNFVGLGVELKQDELGLRLVNVLEGGPASEAGIKVGEKITHVAGISLAGLGLDDSAGRLQGNEGTTVEIVVQGKDGKSRKHKLVRRAVEVRSVSQVKMVSREEGVGYIQLTGFQKTSTDELRQAISALQREKMRYLVLDLRGNPGGLLNVAVDIADLFLDQGVIVTTRGRAPNQSAVYRAQPGAPWRMPVAILVDHDSASASEILAGALKENHRAIVVGERSYGKGSVQSIFPLRTGEAGLKLTTAKFYSPLDHAYSELGVQPDFAVKPHVAARPAGAAIKAPEIEFGDPAADPVLDRAIQQAKRQMTLVR